MPTGPYSSSGAQTQVQMINIWIIYLILQRRSDSRSPDYVCDALLFVPRSESTGGVRVPLKLSGWQTLILNRLQAIVSLWGCQAFSVWIIKVNPLNAACLTVWPHRWCFQQPWQHLTLQRIEPPCHQQVNVTWTWMCEQWHQWSHRAAQKQASPVHNATERAVLAGWRRERGRGRKVRGKG